MQEKEWLYRPRPDTAHLRKVKRKKRIKIFAFFPKRQFKYLF
jgi:hypothetical protein